MTLGEKGDGSTFITSLICEINKPYGKQEAKYENSLAYTDESTQIGQTFCFA